MPVKFSPAVDTATPLLSVDDLQPADILLSKGEGFISDLIAESDGGHYSHGALWSGMGIIQATGDGITFSEIEGTHAVYRYPGLPRKAAEEIVGIAKRQVNGRYAYGELVMLGALFLSGIRVKGALMNRLLDAIGGPTASKLKAWLDARAGKRARVCTELVASAYHQAAGGTVVLKIRSRAGGRAGVNTAVDAPASTGVRSAAVVTRGLAPVVDETELQGPAVTAAQHCLELLLQNDLGNEAGTRKLLAGEIARDAATNEPVGVVTPGDLEFSPSLRFVGRFEA